MPYWPAQRGLSFSFSVGSWLLHNDTDCRTQEMPGLDVVEVVTQSQLLRTETVPFDANSTTSMHQSARNHHYTMVVVHFASHHDDHCVS